MNARDVAFVGIRLIAIYLALQVIFFAAGTAQTLLAWYSGTIGQHGEEVARLMYHGLIANSLYLLVSIALWFGSRRLSHIVVPSTIQPTGEASSASTRRLQAVAFCTVGLFILVLALPKIAGELYRAYLISSVYTPPPDISFDDKMRRIQIAAETILGLSLLLGGGALSGMLVRFREVGLGSEEETSNNTSHADAREAPRCAGDGDARPGGRGR